MGNMYIPLESFFRYLGITVICPPRCSSRTLEIGIKHSPESACLPLKINIGNFIEALELGADTIIMAGGIGPCRFGYYNVVQKEILGDAGYDFNMLVLEPPKGNLQNLLNKISIITNKRKNSLRKILKSCHIAWTKAKILDDVDKITSCIRATELNKGDVDIEKEKIIQLLRNTFDTRKLFQLWNDTQKVFNKIPTNKSNKALKVGIVGEIYTVLEPFVNFDIEKQLNNLGVQVIRSIYMTDWVKQNLFPNFLRPKDHKELLNLSKPYINCFVGGHGQETVAESIYFAQKGFDGIIQLLPFTCMPEIVAKSVLPTVSKEVNIPIMTLVLDEHSAEAGIKTRLEAFVDMIRFKKEANFTNEIFVRH